MALTFYDYLEALKKPTLVPCLKLEWLNPDDTIAYEAWPKFDEAKTIDDEVEIPVQVNGKLRGKVLVAKDATQEAVAEKAKVNEDVLKFIEGKEIVKEIYVPGRMYTIVVK